MKRGVTCCCDPRLLRLEDTPSNRWNNVILFARPRHPSTVPALDWKWRRRDATLTHGLALARRCATDADRKVGLPTPNAHINVQPLRLLDFVQRQRSWRNTQEETRMSSSLDCKRTTPCPGPRPAAEPTPRLQHGGLVWVLRCPHRVYDVERRYRDGRWGSVDGKVTSALVNQSATRAAASRDV